MAVKSQKNPDFEPKKDQTSSPSSQKKTASKPVTPMMAQYIEIKAANPDCLLFYRMGDFYEMFFEDAVEASQALDIQLTSRGTHLGEEIPMCGVPVRSADDYLQQLILKGFRVAVCDQMENPAEAKKRGSKAVVRRDVTRLVTAGTLTEDNLLDPRENNFLISLARVKADKAQEYALAWVDISTGDFQTTSLALSTLVSELTRLGPRELIMPESLFNDPNLANQLGELNIVLTPQPSSHFDSTKGVNILQRFFQVSALEGFGDFSKSELSAAGALIAYVELTQIGHLPAIKSPRQRLAQDYMMIDAATRTNLELTLTLKGERKGSLLSIIDRTITGAGARLLNQYLADPSLQPKKINNRLDAVEYFLQTLDNRKKLRQKLRECPDITRALARLTVGRGSPRDLAGLGNGLLLARDLPAIVSADDNREFLPVLISKSLKALEKSHIELADDLTYMLAHELPGQVHDGGFVRDGYRQELDETRMLRDQSRKVIASLQARYADQAGVKQLKVKHNNILGYFVEITAQHGDKFLSAPLAETFIHRQTMANAMRFTTVELGELEAKITAAANRALAIETGIFEKFVEQVKAHAATIGIIAEGLASLDVYAGLAELAASENYTRPQVDNSLGFAIKGGRHPVVEKALGLSDGKIFVPNDCYLEKQDKAIKKESDHGRRLWLLTGPNMAGKSTFLRQNALIAILAQMGSFVPAKSAYIGVVDKVFSRVGAADDLARGRSTFMVEMVETATILNQAGERSLVILDEIGRGTATFDGLSIAWASIEHLHDINSCRTLFATHFHELTGLSGRLENLSNATMRVKEYEGNVIFLHEVGPGAADRSYGIQVAKLAGLPDIVLTRASAVLAELEKQDRQSPAANLGEDLPLFSANRPKPAKAMNAGPSALESEMAGVLPDELSAREALALLYKLKALHEKDGSSDQ